MNKFPVLILNYMRPDNIKNHIIPNLLNEPIVSKIIIAHGKRDTIFNVDSLEDGEIKTIDNILHIGNYSENVFFRCFRRWNLIHKLKNLGILTEECILVQDDDYYFKQGEIEKLLLPYQQKKGILISGFQGRILSNNSYNFYGYNGNSDIVIGRSIFGSIQTIYNAVEQIRKSNIPINIIKYEDDITISFFTSGKKFNKKHFGLKLNAIELPSPNGVCQRPNHLEQRNNTVKFLNKKYNNIPHKRFIWQKIK